MPDKNFDLEERLANVENEVENICKKLDKMIAIFDKICEQNNNASHACIDDLK